jgi:hypothetical protein
MVRGQWIDATLTIKHATSGNNREASMLKLKREITLKNPGYMDLALVGIDGGGNFHVIGEGGAGTLSAPDEKEAFGFLTYDRNGKLATETTRLKRDVEAVTGVEPLSARAAWPMMQEKLGVFPAEGEITYESGPLDLPYFKEKISGYHGRGPFDPDLPSRWEMILDDLRPSHTWHLIKQIFSYIFRTGSLKFLREPENRRGGFFKMAAFYLNPADFYHFPLRHLIDPRRLQQEGHFDYRMVPAAQELLASLEPLPPEERERVLAFLNSTSRFEEDEFEDEVSHEDEFDEGEIEDDEMDEDEEDSYSEVLGLAAQEAITGVWINPKSALVLRRCLYLLKYPNGVRATDDLQFLDLVTPRGDGSFEVVEFTPKDFPWLRRSGALILTGVSLFVRNVSWNEFYNLKLAEYELDPGR